MGKRKKKGTVEMSNENQKESGEKRRREGKTEENETETVKRRCDGSVSVEAFDMFLSVVGRSVRVAVILGKLLVEESFSYKPEDLSDRESEAWVVEGP